jgi:mannose-6-phosphate isomerase-like protein (cupin superfamily)
MSGAVMGIKPLRRLITIDNQEGKSLAWSDGPVEDIMLDQARPGFSSATVWMTDATPANARPNARLLALAELVNMPHTLEPPPGGSVFRIVTIPPDAGWKTHCSSAAVQAYFTAAGSPQASRHSPQAPHPYMQQTRTLDFCVVLEGRITLVLDTEEVALNAGDTVVQRGTSHAWSNRSDVNCVIAISSHDAEIQG